MAYNDANQPVDAVFFGQLQSNDGSIRHSGDNRTGDGDGDDEVIHVDLSGVPSNVKTLVFTVNSFTGQTFDTVAGHTYRVDFAASRHFLMGGAASFTASALPAGGGAALASLAVTVPTTVGTNSSLATHWQDDVFTFTASSASTTLRCASTSATGGLGPMIDNVRVTDVTPVPPAAVPTLQAWALLGLAGVLGLLGAAGRRQRRS